MRGGGPIDDDFVSAFFDDFFGGSDILGVFRKNIMTLNIIEKIVQHIALPQ
jgi:hypothetical protein